VERATISYLNQNSDCFSEDGSVAYAVLDIVIIFFLSEPAHDLENDTEGRKSTQ
jgi:hypothetical protein